MGTSLTEKDRLELRARQGAAADQRREELLNSQRLAAREHAKAKIALRKKTGLRNPFSEHTPTQLQDALMATTSEPEKAVIFEEIYRRKNRGVSAICHRQTRDEQLTKEAATETWLRVWKHWTENEQVQINVSLNALVNTTARNAACDVFRLDQKQASVRPIEDPEDGPRRRTVRGKRVIPFSEVINSHLSAFVDGGGMVDEFDYDPARYIEALHVQADQEDEADLMLRRRLVKVLVDSLGQALRDTYDAIYVRDLTPAEYAREAGISEQAAWKRRQRLEETLFDSLATTS